MDREKKKPRWIVPWIELGLIGVFLAANYALEKDEESRRRHQADEFWADASPDTLSIFAACNPGVINIVVPEGWAVESLARQAGLAGQTDFFGFEIPAPVPADVLDVYNPALAFRAKRILYARQDGVILPRTNGSLDLSGRLGQYPFPGAAAEGVVEWLSAVDPQAMAGIRARAEKTWAHLQTDWRKSPQNPEIIRDMCIWRLHGAVENGPLWPASQGKLEETLAFYRARYELNDFILATRLYMDIKSPFLNNLLSAAGIDQKFPPDVGKYPIFGTVQNAIGGGWSGPRPWFVVLGNYPDVLTDALGRPYTLNPLLADSGTVSFNQALRPALHEAAHVFIQPPEDWEKFLTEPQWRFAHSGMGLLTMAAEMNAAEFSPPDALDPRVQYIFHTLIYSQTTGDQSAYLQLLRGVMRFENVDKIAATYDQFRQPGDPSFDELFAGESPWVFDNSPYGKYLAGRDDPQSDYQKDVDRLRRIILPLMTKIQAKPPDHHRPPVLTRPLHPDLRLPPKFMAHQSANLAGRQIIRQIIRRR